MAILATLLYPPLLTMPNSATYILKLMIMLVLHSIFILWATRSPADQIVLRIGTLFGAIACSLEIVHILIEVFGSLNARTETISTGLFMISLFVLFGMSGYFAGSNKRNLISGVWTGLWSAVVCMLVVMTYGLSQLFWSFEALEKRIHFRLLATAKHTAKKLDQLFKETVRIVRAFPQIGKLTDDKVAKIKNRKRLSDNDAMR